jgi:hypothetical protein
LGLVSAHGERAFSRDKSFHEQEPKMRSLLALLLCLVATALPAAEDNPFKKAKVGDWVEYKMTSATVGGTTKMTIVAADDKEVIYEVTSTFTYMGQESAGPVQKLKVDLTKSYDPIIAANLKRTGTKIEKVGEGTETIKVGGKRFKTKWTKLKSTTVVNDVTVVSEFHSWYSKDVPLSGLVRMDTTTGMMTMRLELIGSGRK